MANKWREKVIAYNKKIAEKTEKATDMELLAAKIAELPKGQLKKVLTEEIIEILRRNGVDLTEEV